MSDVRLHPACPVGYFVVREGQVTAALSRFTWERPAIATPSRRLALGMFLFRARPSSQRACGTYSCYRSYRVLEYDCTHSADSGLWLCKSCGYPGSGIVLFT